MIQSIEFSNFKALRKTTLPLAPFTLLLGPNGSGKSSVLDALRDIANLGVHAGRPAQPVIHLGTTWASLRSVTTEDLQAPVEARIRLQHNKRLFAGTFRWGLAERSGVLLSGELARQDGTATTAADNGPLWNWLSRMQIYVLDAPAIAAPAQVSGAGLEPRGGALVAVLDDLKDNHQARWEALLAEMQRWLPEYDQIHFDKPAPGQKRIMLRTRKGGHRIPASDLSQGTLVALAVLTLAYLPDPPSLIGVEELDRGLHPRLLRHVQDALYRLSYPECCGETRPPIQVIATTHSPYLLDLYRDHPEEVVLAQKEGLEVTMKRLSDIEHFDEILGDAPLSEVWYSGVLGGVSAKP